MAASETRWQRTWYGLAAYVTLGPGFLHRAGFGRVKIPHPPIANWLLRQGLPTDVKRRLSFVHEFAHLQTAPVALLYLLALLGLFYQQSRTGPVMILGGLVSTQAVWELLSESLVLIGSREEYMKSYASISKLPRALFWGACAVLAAAGWLAVI